VFLLKNIRGGVVTVVGTLWQALVRFVLQCFH